MKQEELIRTFMYKPFVLNGLYKNMSVLWGIRVETPYGIDATYAIFQIKIFEFRLSNPSQARGVDPDWATAGPPSATSAHH